MMSLLVGLHVAAPPLAVAVDLVLGAWGIVEMIEEREEQMEDFRAMLDPADAIVRPPSGLPVLVAIVQAIPFTRWYTQAGAAALPFLLAPVEEE